MSTASDNKVIKASKKNLTSLMQAWNKHKDAASLALVASTIGSIMVMLNILIAIFFAAGSVGVLTVSQATDAAMFQLSQISTQINASQQKKTAMRALIKAILSELT